MSLLLTLLTIAVFTTSASAATLNVRNFGAKGDGLTLDTAAIQSALDAAAKSGDTVTFAPGTYLTGSVFLKSNVTLRIGRNVTLLGSQHLSDYPVMPTRIAGIEMSWPQRSSTSTSSPTPTLKAKAPSTATAKYSGTATGTSAKGTNLAAYVGPQTMTPNARASSRSSTRTLHLKTSSDRSHHRRPHRRRHRVDVL